MKKGFTLIELLAVIVILAIIAVIAVPIVINIIDETKENANLRSAEFYKDAVELSVAQATLKNQNVPDGTYNILESGNICLEYTDTTCTEELEVEVNGEVPKTGTITISNGNIDGLNMVLGNKTIVKNENGTLEYKQPVCTNVSGTSIQVGSQIKCGTYNFHAISTSSETITLLSDVNIEDDIQYFELDYVGDFEIEVLNNVEVIFENFKNDLKEIDLDIIEIRNLTLAELNGLGCTDDGCIEFDENLGPVAKENVPTWLYADDYSSSFYLGVPEGEEFEDPGMTVNYLDGLGSIDSITYCLGCGGDFREKTAGVRPVIKISINDIK